MNYLENFKFHYFLNKAISFNHFSMRYESVHSTYKYFTGGEKFLIFLIREMIFENFEFPY